MKVSSTILPNREMISFCPALSGQTCIRTWKMTRSSSYDWWKPRTISSQVRWPTSCRASWIVCSVVATSTPSPLEDCLQSFDTQLLEAAQIDGANGWQRLRYVILPMMKPLILFVVAIRAMDAFRFFDLVYVLTNGGPGTATETITLYTYQLGFQLLQVGKASALGIITLIMVAAIIATFSGILQRGYGRSG